MHFVKRQQSFVLFHRHIWNDDKLTLGSDSGAHFLPLLALYQHFLARSLALSLSLCALMFISRNKMNEIYLSWVFCLSLSSLHTFRTRIDLFFISHMLSGMCVCSASASHTINSLLHYALNECASRKKEKHSHRKHTHSKRIKCTNKRTTATCYTSVIERLPQNHFSPISSLPFLLLPLRSRRRRCCFFFALFHLFVSTSVVFLCYFHFWFYLTPFMIAMVVSLSPSLHMIFFNSHLVSFISSGQCRTCERKIFS